MQKIGQILKEARIARKLTLEDVEKATRIRQKILVALEKGDWHNLPSEPYISGLVKNYAEFLGLSPPWLLALFRREYQVSRLPAVRKNQPFLIDSGTKLGFNRVLSGGIIVLLLASVLYLLIQYFLFVGIPRLEVISPKEGAEVALGMVDIVGKTDPDAQLFINGQKVDLLKDGSFSSTVKVSSPVTTLEIVAKGKLGREKKIVRTVRSSL